MAGVSRNQLVEIDVPFGRHNLRRLIMAPALLATLALAGPAEARVEQKTVSESASSIKSYWTADRMRAAKPAEQQFGGALPRAPKPAALPWTSEEITTPYTQAPTSTHGKVFFTLGGNDYVCSGTALLSGNKSVVWTAGPLRQRGPGRLRHQLAVRPRLQGRLGAARRLRRRGSVRAVGVGELG